MTTPKPDLEIAILLDQTRQLAIRLERLSADSIWARRASGSRGSLLRHIERLEQAIAGGNPLADAEMESLQLVVNHSARLLEAGACELLKGRTGWHSSRTR